MPGGWAGEPPTPLKGPKTLQMEGVSVLVLKQLQADTPNDSQHNESEKGRACEGIPYPTYLNLMHLADIPDIPYPDRLASLG